MRRPFTTAQAIENGVSLSALKWGIRSGTMQRVRRGVYIRGAEVPNPIEHRLALLVGTGGVASHSLAALLLGLDGVDLFDPCITVPSRLRTDDEVAVCPVIECSATTVRGYRCTNGTQTMLDLAAVVDDLVWEQALESALRKKLTTIEAIEGKLPALGRARTPGVARIRRVLMLRVSGVPPTESLLETLAVQCIRADAALPVPDRQVEIYNGWGDFIARVDLAYPDHGVFLELDGQQHAGQPVYDAVRQTAVVATTKWLPARFTWDDVTKRPQMMRRRLRQLLLSP